MFTCKNQCIQPKLTIGSANDHHEQEADAMADQILRMPQSEGNIQRKCEDCEEDVQMKPLSTSITPLVQRVCKDCEEQVQMQREEEEETLQMKRNTTPIASSDISNEIQQSKGNGASLPDTTNQFMSNAFGADFSQVNIHTGTQAIQMNRSLGARAFTYGNDIYFNQGEYNPRSQSGKHLLAHELTHVVQQNGAAEGIQRSFKDGQQETCGGAITCASSRGCTEPDNPQDGPFVCREGATYELKIHIDIAVNTVHDIDEGSDVGHTYVEFSDSSGAIYTYGFYPSPNDPTPDPSGILGSRTARGCIVHPDVSHVDCIDHTETFILTLEQYNQALSFVQGYCRSPNRYHVFTNNCTTWAGAVAAAAGQSLPNMRESVSVPLAGSHDADNPNTLLESIREREE